MVSILPGIIQNPATRASTMGAEAMVIPGSADGADGPTPELSRLAETLIERGAIDNRSLDRAWRVAGETGNRLDHVLTQLGMVSERGLAETFAQLIDAPLVRVTDYPDAALFADRLKPKFLRKARALPIAEG